MWYWVRSLFKRNKKPVLGKDYEVLETNTAKNPVKILKGKFKGIVLYYGDVIPPSEHNLSLKFDYEVTENPNNINYEKDSQFNSLIGDILVELIMISLEQ